MKITNRFFGFLLAGLFLVSFTGLAQKTEVIKSPSKMAADVINVNKIDFKTEFGSSNSALSKLAELITDGRRDGDVKALVSAAMILFMEENTTGKKAPVTGKALLEEATEKATTQKNYQALLACSDAWAAKTLGNNPAKASELAQLAAQAKADKAAGLRGPGAKECSVRVENYSQFEIHIYIDDVYMGEVEPGYYIHFKQIGSGETKLYAETDYVKDPNSGEDTYYYWEGSINLKSYKDDKPDFTWQLQ